MPCHIYLQSELCRQLGVSLDVTSSKTIQVRLVRQIQVRLVRQINSYNTGKAGQANQ